MLGACLFSGGKDSTLALHKAIEEGADIGLLITMRSSNPESYMFHYPNIEYTKLQAQALGIKQVICDTKGIKEDELRDLENVLIENKVSLLVTGATYSEYQASRINKIAEKLGIEHLAPLWHIDPIKELEEISEKYEAIITAVSAEGLDSSFLGERIDKRMIDRLSSTSKRFGINMLFEGGEAESFVLDAPLFRKRIVVNNAEKQYTGLRGMYLIKDAVLADK
jgi:ABC transporter with metal-binding/Fe-S-binding domain ATP-binding protein